MTISNLFLFSMPFPPLLRSFHRGEEMIARPNSAGIMLENDENLSALWLPCYGTSTGIAQALAFIFVKESVRQVLVLVPVASSRLKIIPV